MIPVHFEGVPMEAIRAGVGFASARELLRLTEDRAVFQPSHAVELTSQGFVAHVRYERPGSPDRVWMKTLGLVWTPSESLRVLEGRR